jgi:hypothetical protein
MPAPSWKIFKKFTALGREIAELPSMSENISAVSTENTEQEKLPRWAVIAANVVFYGGGLGISLAAPTIADSVSARMQSQRPAAVVPMQNQSVSSVSTTDAQGFVRSTRETPAQSNLRVVYQGK